jgi:hypothetical protein
MGPALRHCRRQHPLPGSRTGSSGTGGVGRGRCCVGERGGAETNRGGQAGCRARRPRPRDESGFDLAQRIQSETSLDQSRVILISTYAEEDFVDLITATPVAGFLSKSHLSARAIREILGNAGDSEMAMI